MAIIDRLEPKERVQIAEWLRLKAQQAKGLKGPLRQKAKRAAHNLLAIDRLKKGKPSP